MASPATAAPAPVNGNGSNGSNGNEDPSTKEAYLEGMIYPPPDIRSIVDKTASFIAKHPNPAAFTDKIRQREKTDSKFSFLNESDAYHAYYQHRITQFKDGTAGGAGGAAIPTAAANAANAAAASGDAVQTANTAIAGAAGELVDEGRPTVPQPRPFEFNNAQRPPMAAVDADILRLTALFTARMGRGFTSDLAAREAGNYQFGFLQPSHSFFGYFNRLVEQYTKVLMAPHETLAVLDRQAGYTAEYDDLLSTEAKRKAIARREIMKDVENRVEWTKYDHARRQAEDSKMEEERVAFQSIDWQDVSRLRMTFTTGCTLRLVIASQSRSAHTDLHCPVIYVSAVHRRHHGRLYRTGRTARPASAHVALRGRGHDARAEEDGCHDHGGQGRCHGRRRERRRLAGSRRRRDGDER